MTPGRPATSVRWLSGYLRRVRSDSLVRNSIYLMASTVVTAGLGYVFWAVAAHTFTSQEVGIGGAVISLCSTAALLTYLGSSAMLIERLPENEHSSTWTAILLRVCLVTAGVTAVATAVAVPVLMTSPDYHSFFSSAVPIVLAVAGAAAWTLVNLLGAAFIAARRAGRFMSIQTLVSAAKVLLLLPLAAVGAGAVGLVGAWVASAVLGVCVGAVWLVPRMGLGRAAGLRPHRRGPEAALGAEGRAGAERRGTHRRPAGLPSARLPAAAGWPAPDQCGGRRDPAGPPRAGRPPARGHAERVLLHHLDAGRRLLHGQPGGLGGRLRRGRPGPLRPAPRGGQGPARDRRDAGACDGGHDRGRAAHPRAVRARVRRGRRTAC